MRITGGTLGGRRLEVSPTIRPTQDMVRQAIFSVLAARVPEARVLDLFAGSGSLGLEAWSRGAASVCWVEGDGKTGALLKKNVETLAGAGVGRDVVRADALAFLARQAAGRGPWDLILADPPYDREGHIKWLEKTLSALSGTPILAPDGILVFEMSREESAVTQSGWELFWERTYGGTRVGMWRNSIVQSNPDSIPSDPDT